MPTNTKSTSSSKTKTKNSKKQSTAQKTPAQKKSTSQKSTTKKNTLKKTSTKTTAKTASTNKKAEAKKTASAKAKTSKNKRQKLIDELRNNLLEERKQLVQKALKDQNIKESSMHGDIVDQSNDYLDRELLMGLAEHDRLRLQEIDEAIKRMDEGTYGICLMSGEEISDERLMAMPTAKYTLECQSKLEGHY